MSKESQVKWTDEEREAIADKAASMRLDRPEDSILDLIRAAQELVLPIGRRRGIRVKSDCSDVVEKVLLRIGFYRTEYQAYQESKSQKGIGEDSKERTQPIILPPPPDPEEVLAGLTDEALCYYLSQRKLHPVSLLRIALPDFLYSLSLGHADTEDRLKVLSGAVSRLEGRLDQVLLHINRTIAREEAKAEAKVEPRKKKVVICGLKSNQTVEMARACNETCKMHFLLLGVRVDTFPECDYCFMFVDYLGHDFVNQAISQLGSEKVIRHHGGITSGIDALSRLVKRTE